MITLDERVAVIEKWMRAVAPHINSLLPLGPIGPRELTEEEHQANNDLLHAIHDEEVKNESSPGKKTQITSAPSAVIAPPPDRTKRVLANGAPVTPDHRDINPATGQQKAYVVLSEDERARGFVRPVRSSYKHQKCQATTTMGIAIAETYARDPGFYTGTFCCTCGAHFPLDEFVWSGTNEKVGS